MGVPKFFRYISERYPCLSEIINEYQIPEFDNLYLDMNGIIHMCSHPDDYDPHFRISEEKIFSDIFHYIEVLFRMIKPQRLFFMAVDGVAPRAKMNQQRGRRFRSAKEAEQLEAKAKERGEELPAEARFDSNCITPGTVFMARLHEQLKYFVTNKISTDRLWQNCKIILSGHETPGEGEHKIMDYIRFLKSQPGYDPNTRHCLYGLDADLIMLGLCSHEPHFSLLREEVRFGKKAKRKNIPEQINFYLLHLSLMREYLELEFLPLQDSLPFEYDMEKIIDDWVLMGFLVGNDFIPHLPNLHIANGALPVLYNAYMKILPTLEGYINEAGALNLERFEKFMSALAAIDMDHFSESYADLKYFCSKTGRRPNGKERTSYKPRDLEVWQADDSDLGVLEDIPPPTMNKELEALIKSTDDMLLGDSFLQSESPTRTKIINLNLAENPELIVTAKIEDLMSEPITEVGSCATEDLMILLPSLENKVAVPTVEPSSIPELEALIPSLENKVAETVTEEPTPKKHTLLEPSESNLAELALDDVDLHFSEEEDEDVSPYLSESDTEDDKTMLAEFLLHKTDYYMNKLDYTKVTPEVMRDQAEGYVRAIQWNLHYYYNGVCSWSWYYPHHYAPFISDIKDFANLKLEYDLATPFHPFEQLLAVLPAASKTLLPEPYQELMTSDDSKIIDYYPQDFRTDLNGKKQEWEAVVLIPFIAEDLLLDAMGPCYEKLSEAEIIRNTHGPMLVYEFTAEDLGTYIAPEFFPSVTPNHAKLTPITMEEIRVPIEKLIKGPCPGSIHDVYYPGFPTLRHLKYDGQLEKAKVKVFDQPSQNENMIVKIISNETNINIETLAKELLGTSVHVSWPHLIEGQVITVSDSNVRYHKTAEPGKYNIEINKGSLGQLWYSQKHGITSHYKDKLGIEVGPTSILIHVKTLVGSKYAYTQAGRINFEKQWAEVESCYPLQAVVQQLKVYESIGPKFETIQELFPMNSKCFMIGHPHYGCLGEVIDNISLKSGRIKISMNVFLEPDLNDVYLFEQEIKYMPGGAAAQRCAITPHLLSRITGTIFAIPGYKGNTVPKSSNKINIGLNLKLNKKNEEIPGYTKKVDGLWLYSMKSVNLVRDYLKYCPALFSYMGSHMGNDVFFESELFPDEIGEGRIQKLVDWIKSQPFSQVDRQKVGSKTVDIEIVKKIEGIVDNCNASQKNPKQVIMQVKPHLLYKPEIQTGHLPPDITVQYKLYDRVVNVREGFTVPFGCKGTVIGIQTSIQTGNNGDENMEVMYDVVFDQEFAGGLQINCSANRGYRLPKTALINISHGMRQVQQKTVNPATNNPWYGKLPMNHQQQQQQKSQPVQSQNSAFASWNPPPNSNNFTRPHHQPPAPQQKPQPPMFASQQMQHPVPNLPFGHSMNHHRIATPPRPQINKANSNVSAEFHAFLQDLQKTQGKGKSKASSQAPNIVQSHMKPAQQVLGQVQPQLGQFNTMYNVPSATPKSPRKKVPQQAGSTDETEALKKLLNISVTNDTTKQPSPLPSDVKNVTQQISVQDFFAHARNKEQKMTAPPPATNSPFYSVQLLNYCQAQRIGIPRYNYFTRNDNIRAQITLQDGRMVIGDESTTKEEATESAAKILMTEGHALSANSPVRQSRPHPQPFMFQGPNIGPKGFPVPPKQWCQNSQRPQQHQQQQQKTQRPIVNKNSPSAKQPFPNKQATEGHPNMRKQQQPKLDETKIGASPFVPLQAVKHRTKSGSSGSDTTTAKHNKNSATNQSNSSNNHVSKSKSATTPEKSSNQQQQSTSNSQPKQKVRKSRIAANFGGAPKNQK